MVDSPVLCYAKSMNSGEFDLPTETFDTCATHPLGRALRLLGDVPTLMIVCALLPGTKRFGEVRAAMADVSPKTISQRLKMLEELDVVRRQAFAEIPPRVEYRLTEKGRALHDIITAIQGFGERYLACDAPQLPPPAQP
jgi:DNA-binding HxlR family transcriptional regulator